MISVICSVYNSSQYLDRYLKYLNDQLLREFEVIFVDAKSTDDSLQKIQNFSFREGISARVLACEKRINIYEAWNLAIEKSTHDYVMNYNTDDKLFRSALQTVFMYSRLYPGFDIIYSNALITKDIDHSTFSGSYIWKDANVKEQLLSGCCVGPFPLLKKKSIMEAGMFNTNFHISGDYEMWCRMQSKGYKFAKIDEPIGVYYENPQGTSTQQTAERYTENVRQDTAIRQRYA